MQTGGGETNAGTTVCWACLLELLTLQKNNKVPGKRTKGITGVQFGALAWTAVAEASLPDEMQKKYGTEGCDCRPVSQLSWENQSLISLQHPLT